MFFISLGAWRFFNIFGDDVVMNNLVIQMETALLGVSQYMYFYRGEGFVGIYHITVLCTKVSPA